MVCSYSQICHGSCILKYLQAHPEVKKWWTVPFIHYNEFHALIEGWHATGEHAYRVSLASDNKVPSDTTLAEDLEDVDNNINTSQLINTTSQVS